VISPGDGVAMPARQAARGIRAPSQKAHPGLPLLFFAAYIAASALLISSDADLPCSG